jgi:hypothetical protein
MQSVTAQWILGTLAAVFAVLVVVRLVRTRGRWDPAAKTWALIAVIFCIVSVVLSR